MRLLKMINYCSIKLKSIKMKTSKNKITLYVSVILCSIIVLVVNILSLKNSHQSTKATYKQESEEIKEKDPLTDVIISSPTLKVGEVKKGTIIKHDFSILNVGDKPLIIYDIIPDCTCTECNLSKKLILPDDKAIISAVIDTKGKYGNSLVNIIVRDNSKEGAHRFIITGHV